MKNKTVNKKILRAMSIGLAAMMTVQPVLATPVFADDDIPEGEPNTSEEEQAQAQEIKSSDAIDEYREMQSAAADVMTYTDLTNCGDALDSAVGASRDTDDPTHRDFDTNNGGKSLNSARDDVKALSYYNDKLTSTVDGTVVYVDADRKVLADDAETLVQEAKRGVSGNYGKLDGNNRDFDAHEIAKVINGTFNNETKIESKAKAVDTAINEGSKNIAALDADLAKADKEIEEAYSVALSESKKLNDATSEAEAIDAKNAIEIAKNEAVDTYEKALAEYNSAVSAYNAQVKKINAAKNDYKTTLEKQIRDGGNIDKTRVELEQAQKNLETLENDAQKMQDRLTNTVIGNLAQALENTSKPEASEDDLDDICRDLIKYYYFPSINVQPSVVTVDEEFTKFSDSDSKYIKATVGDDEYYFNYTCSDEDGRNSSNMVIFRKNLEVETEAHFVDSNQNKVEFEEKDVISIDVEKDSSSDLTGKIILKSGDTETTYYKVSGVTEDGEKSFVKDSVEDTDDGKDGQKDTITNISVSSEIVYDEAGKAKLVETTKGNVTTTTFEKNVSLTGEKVFTGYASYNDAHSAAAEEVKKAVDAELTSISADGAKYELQGEENDITYVENITANVNTTVNATFKTKFKTTIDISKKKKDAENIDDVLKYINGRISEEDGEITREGDTVTFVYFVTSDVEETYTDKVDAEKMAETEEKAIESAAAKAKEDASTVLGKENIIGILEKLHSGYSGSGNGTLAHIISEIKDESTSIISTGVDGEATIETEATYDVTISGVQYDRKSSVISENQEISIKSWDLDELNYVDATYKSDDVEILDMSDKNNAVYSDVSKVNALLESYKNSEEKANVSRVQVETAQDKVNTLIDKIKTEAESLEEKVNNRLNQLWAQLQAANVEREKAEKDKNMVVSIWENAVKTFDSVLDKLANVDDETGTEEKTDETVPSVSDTATQMAETTVAVLNQAISQTSTPETTSETLAAPASSVGEVPVIGAPAQEVEIADAANGVAGTRVANGLDSVGESEEVLESVGVDEDLNGKVRTIKRNKKLVEGEKEVIKTINDEEVPLASFPDETTKKMNWWWLLIVALLGATGEEMYRRNQKKKEEKAALKSEDDK
ncbi:MAG: hypothetical protein Q4D29_02705 [Lachnospiraceae bacterium]|nr:hypothetical protein [Lachnospiraceae bacterium]